MPKRKDWFATDIVGDRGRSEPNGDRKKLSRWNHRSRSKGGLLLIANECGVEYKAEETIFSEGAYNRCRLVGGCRRRGNRDPGLEKKLNIKWIKRRGKAGKVAISLGKAGKDGKSTSREPHLPSANAHRGEKRSVGTTSRGIRGGRGKARPGERSRHSSDLKETLNGGAGKVHYVICGPHKEAAEINNLPQES